MFVPEMFGTCGQREFKEREPTSKTVVEDEFLINL